MMVTGEKFSSVTLFLGVGTGVALVVAANLYARALSSGPLVLSSALFGISSLFAVAYCAIYPGEPLSGIQIVGYLLLLVGGFIITQGKRGDDENSTMYAGELNKHWVFLILAAVFVNSLIPYGIRIQAQTVEGDSNFMLFCYFGTASVCNFFLARKKGCFRDGCIGRMREALLVAVVMAAVMCLNTWAQARIGAMHVPAVSQYPVINACILVGMVITGRCFYGEKISKSSACAMGICVIASVLTCL